MDNHLEQYQARDGGVTLHTWTEVEGRKKGELLHYRGSGTQIPAWFREVLRQKHLSDIADFPYSPSRFYE